LKFSEASTSDYSQIYFSGPIYKVRATISYTYHSTNTYNSKSKQTFRYAVEVCRPD